MKFDITFLPARYGDCIWLEYGQPGDMHRVLIDGGTGGTREDIKKMIAALPEDDRHFELMVVTHIDQDHIEGLLTLLEQDELDFTIGDFWFNGWPHLPGNEDEEFGAVMGERLSAALLNHEIKWNKAFAKKAVVVPKSGKLPVKNIAGGLKLTILSPYIRHLENLRPKWVEEIKKHGLVPGFGLELPVADPDDGEEHFGLIDVDALNDEAFHEDKAEANGSSIAFLAEFEDKAVLFTGDAYPSVVLESLDKLYDDKATLDLVKLSHHASAHNTSPELIEKFKCKKYLISTNGSKFHHPAAITISKVIKRGGTNPQLIFNYTSEDNKAWNSPALQSKHKYRTVYPQGDGIKVKVL